YRAAGGDWQTHPRNKRIQAAAGNPGACAHSNCTRDPIHFWDPARGQEQGHRGCSIPLSAPSGKTLERTHSQAQFPMKIALVTAFPPSRHGLNEYGFHVADELRRHRGLDVTILADHLPEPAPELADFSVLRRRGFN